MVRSTGTSTHLFLPPHVHVRAQVSDEVGLVHEDGGARAGAARLQRQAHGARAGGAQRDVPGARLR